MPPGPAKGASRGLAGSSAARLRDPRGKAKPRQPAGQREKGGVAVGQLTPEQVGAHWLLAGGPEEATRDAISYSYVESGHDTTRISSAGYVGLWQCGQDRANLDPVKNAECAVAKFRDGGNSFVKHWDNFQAAGTNAKRIAYLPRAAQAASRVIPLNANELLDLIGAQGKHNWLGKDPTAGVFGAGGIPNPLDPIKDLAKAVTDVLAFLFGPDAYKNWLRIGKVVLGVAALILGVVVIGRGAVGGSPIGALRKAAG